MKSRIKKFIKRKKVDSAEYIEEAAEHAPRITNETVAAHREEVLSSARKYILPLQHSKHQIVVVTTTLFIAGVVAFFTYCTLALYKFHTNSTFLYRVTQVMPFPVARVGGHFVAYENYLFELRRYTHYYENQQKTNFDDPKNKGQLENFKQVALDKVINDAYVKELAAKHNVSVTDKEVNAQIDVVRNQNRLGGSDKVFADVLKDYWGWSIDDFRRSLRQQMLAQKVVATLDTDTTTRAQQALTAVQGGADFAAVAKQYSDDAGTKDKGGEFGYPIDRTTRNINPQTTDELFKLQPGQISGIITTGTGLEIVKNIEVNGDKVRAAHIQFNFKDISTYIDDLKKDKKPQTYI
jgi:hypothetical protein